MKLLVVEDEPRILGFLVRGLEAEGFAVDGARDGDEGLARALGGGYDLLILDLLLPGLDGLSLLQALRPRRPGLPVVVLSARTDLRTKLLGFELGADDYVSKPFSFEELLARVRARLPVRPAGEGDPVLRSGDLVLHLLHREARVGDRVVALSDREFRLLRHLAEHAGQTISRERLLSEVWGIAFRPGSNVVDVYVRRLRRKLGPGARIDTVRQVGYRLAAG